MGGLDRMKQNWDTQRVATGDPEADALLRADGNALLLGVLFDQQMRAEVAFSGPLKLRERIGHLDMQALAEMDAASLVAVFEEKPAIHRFPSTMAARTQKLAQAIVDDYAGAAANLWAGADTRTIERRAVRLPGFGKAKVTTLVHALSLFGHTPAEEAAG